jgi:proteasome lid subunit RPN8/RPN11
MPVCTVAYEDSAAPSTTEEDAEEKVLSVSERDRLEAAAYKYTPAKLKLMHDGHPSVLVRSSDGATVLDPLYRMCDEKLVAYARSVGVKNSMTSKSSEAPADAPAGAPVGGAAESAGYAIVTRDPAKFAEWRARATSIGPLKNAKCIHDLLATTCNSEDQEVFLVVPLDLRGDLRCEPIEIARGQRDRVSVNSEDVLRAVVGSGCQGFVVVHNHPSGKCHPSPADKKLTATIKKATKETFPHIAFVDHVIIASEGFYSFTDDKTTKTPRSKVKETPKASKVEEKRSKKK